MKKFLFAIVTVVLLCVLLMGIGLAESSGSCGENVSWSFDDSTGVLTISGSGDMAYGTTPWHNLPVQSVVIDEGVTKISENAFSGIETLTRVEIGHSVSVIGYYAFSNCTNLEYVTIKGEPAFDQYVFSGDNNFIIRAYPGTNAEIWAMKDKISFEPLSYSQSGTCGSDLFWKLDDETGVLNISGKGRMLDYGEEEAPWGTDIRSVKIYPGVKSIGDNAFADCSQLCNVQLPYGLLSVGQNAFYNCTSLQSIDLPSSIEVIKDRAFLGSGLIKIDYPGTIKVIETLVFANCTNLVSVDIQEGVELIKSQAFAGCTSLRSIFIPKSINNIDGNAFQDCSALESVMVMNSTLALAEMAFERNPTLTLHGYSNSTLENYADINDITFAAITEESDSGSCGDGVFWKLDSTGLLTIFGEGAMTDFKGDYDRPWNTDIKRVVVEDGVTHIGNYAFENCKMLRSISLPESVISLGNYAINLCDSLTSIALPSGLKRVGYEAIRYCANLKELILPDSLTEIGDTAFELNISMKRVVLPSTITNLPHCMFYTSKSLETIELPATITSMADQVFYHCISLKTIELPDGLTEVGESAFNLCTGLSNVKLPKNLKIIRQYAFQGCTNLAEIHIPNGTTTIQYHAFADCPNLHIYIPETVINIDKDAFYNSNNSEKTVIHGYIGSYAQTYASQNGFTFEPIDIVGSGTCGTGLNWRLDSDGLLMITGTGEMNHYTDQGPWGTGVKEVQLTEGLTSIGSYAFAGCTELTEISIPQSVAFVGENAFPNTAIRYAAIGSDAAKAVSRAGYSFREPGDFFWLQYFFAEDGTESGLTLVSVPDKQITKAVVPEGVTTLADQAFNGCTELKQVVLPASVKDMGRATFMDCSSLQTINIPDGVTTLESDVFYKCTSLRSVVIPESVNRIGSSVFSCCESLEEITFTGDQIEYISNFVFSGCAALRTVRIYGSVDQLYEQAFDQQNNVHLIVDGDLSFNDNVYTPVYVSCLTWKGYDFMPSNGIRNLGKCGNDVYWILMGKDLTIFGNGPMDDFTFDGNSYNPDQIMNMYCSAPWWQYMLNGLTSVQIYEGVTRIGDYAFTKYSSLGTVTLSKTVSSIGNSAFMSTSTTIYHDPVDYDLSKSNYGGSLVWIMPQGECGESAQWQFVSMDQMRITGNGQVVKPEWDRYAGNKTTLIVGAQITGINSDVLSSLPDLTTVIFEGDVPADMNSTLSGFSGTVCYQHGKQGWTAEARNINGIQWQQYCALNGAEVTLCQTEAVELLPCTCTEDGHFGYWKCTVCGQLFADEELLTATTPESVVIPASGHVEVVIEGIPATCTEPGLSDEIFCEVCGETLQEAVETEPIPHEDVITREAQDPTCTTPGHTAEHSCAMCGEILEASEEIPVIPHTDSITVEEMAATCTEAGHTAEHVCAVCGTVLSASETIPATGHHYREPVFNWAEDASGCTVTLVCSEEDDTQILEAAITAEITVEPTCLEMGQRKYTASAELDGQTYTDTITRTDVAATGHQAVIDEGYPATDHEEGLSDGSHCAVCGEVLSEQTVIPAKWSYSEDGTTVTAYNAADAEAIVPEGVTALSDTLFKDNEFVTTVRVPDGVTSVGKQTFYGMRAAEDIWLPDQLSGIVTQTFYNNNARLHCTIGSDTAKLLSLRSKNFTDGEWTLRYRVTSVTSDPTAVYLAGWLGEEHELVLPAEFGGVPLTQIQANAFAGKEQLERIVIPASVTTIGSDAFAGCGEELVIVSAMNATAHAWATSNGFAWEHDQHSTVVEPGVAATCTEPGLSERVVCEECGAVIQEQEEIPALGHTPVINVAVAPTCTEAGLTGGTHCEICGEMLEEAETIPALGHTPVTDAAVSPTCTEAGLTEGSHCEVCGEVLTAQEEIPALGHSPVADAAVEPTETETGLTEGSHCEVCGAILVAQEVIPALGDDGSKRGTCGDNATWVLDDKGLLTVSGSGRIENMTPYNDAWHPYKDSIYKVIIESGITSVGEYAFYECKNITQVEISEGVVSLDGHAFECCNELATVILPSSLTTIKEEVFRDCNNLMEVTLPNDITSIHERAFYCSPTILISQINSQTALSLGRSGFHFMEVNGNYQLQYLFEDDLQTGLEIKNVDKEAENIIIPEEVTIIGESAFRGCKSLTEITIPVGIVKIGTDAFNGCESLISIDLPFGLGGIENNTFRDCSSLENVTIPESVAYIGERSFENCKSLKTIVIPEGVTSIETNTFYGCSNLTNITIPESVTNIGPQAFAYCGLENIVIPDGVTSVGYYAFYGCYPIRYASMNAESAKALGKADYSFYIPGNDECELKYIFNGESLIGLELCGAKGDLTSITIPDGVTSIAMGVFWNHTALASANLPESLVDLGFNTFYGCINLTDVNVPNGVTEISSRVFCDCSSLSDLHIPESVTKIGYAAFSGCTSLVNLILPRNLTSIDAQAFYGCSNLTSIEIPENVSVLPNEVFSGCSSLTQVLMTEHVTSIGDYAFSGCDINAEFSILDGLTEIGKYAFPNGRGLYANIDSDGAKTLSKNGYEFSIPGAFYSLQYMFDEENIKGLQLYRVKKNSTSFAVPEFVTSIGPYAFSECDSQIAILLPENIDYVDSSAFNANYGYVCRYIYCGKDTLTAYSVSKAGYYFRIPGANYDLKYLYDGDTQTGLELKGVDENIKVFTIPEGVTMIGEWAFGGNQVKSLTIPESVTELRYGAFQGCGQLEKILIPESVSTFGDDLFSTSPVIYCYEFSNADAWATDHGYEVRYLDGTEEEDIRTVNVEGVDRMAVGTEHQLVPVIFPATAEAALWTTSDENVAAVDENGKLTAIGRGTATITVTVGTVSDAFEVEVYQPTTGFELSETEVWLAAKQSIQLFTVNVEPEDAETAVVWSSSDTSAAEISETGLVTTKKVGTVTIYAEDNGIRRECLIHLCYPVKTISFENEESEIVEEDTLQLTATVTTTRDDTYENRLITFTSSDESVLTVDRSGLVTAVYPGTAEVTATADSGVTAVIQLTVKCREHLVIVDPAVPPTEEESGCTEGSHCGRCGEIFAEQREIPALNTLSVMKLPAGLIEIEEEAFVGLACEAVIIPEGCVSIGSRAFAECERLIYVRIPASVETVAEDAFEGCPDAMVDRVKGGE